MAKTPNNLSSPVQFIKGVGPKKAELFAKLGVHTVEDLLYHFPTRYEDRSTIKTISQIEVGETAVVEASVQSVAAIPRRKGRRVFEVIFQDDTGILRASWFAFSEKALRARFVVGSGWVVSGKVSFNNYRRSKTMIHPDTEPKVDDAEGPDSIHFGRIAPVYPLTEGLSQKSVRAAIHTALDQAGHMVDIVPEYLNQRLELPALAESVKQTHWPPEDADLGRFANFQAPEQKKLIFNEFFLLQTGLALKRNQNHKQEIAGTAMQIDKRLSAKIRSYLPFELTGAQTKVLNEIAKDLRSDSPMNRLLQGDVGAGKTAVALCCALIAVANKKQAAIMAPTEILAGQHYKNITNLLGATKINIELLTAGSAGKKAVYEKIERGDTHIAIGTHALIQENVTFHDLGLVVVDEQHRFGVLQRAELIKKGLSPHTLIMTATPIPRTLAMTLYGDLDVSVIDELPPGRPPLETKIYTPQTRAAAINIVRQQIAKGKQAYIVYPLVEESEKLELKAAVTMFEQFRQDEFEGLRLGLTHGRMKSAEKEQVMDQFMRGDIDILVSTTVIEVGIDQPNATVMMIEHAERFGLSQLHQLRGRVGRGVDKSHCLLMAECKPGSPSWERLNVLEKSRDGFKIAEADLTMRGAGDFFGARQSGMPEFKVGNILRDYQILAEARNAAFDLVQGDPKLEKPEHRNLHAALTEKWKEKFELGEIG